MPKRERPEKVERSEHWIRVMANEHAGEMNNRLIAEFGAPWALESQRS